MFPRINPSALTFEDLPNLLQREKPTQLARFCVVAHADEPCTEEGGEDGILKMSCPAAVISGKDGMRTLSEQNDSSKTYL